ncbi:MAG TPA: ABC transporter permease [Terriglobales bacterium]|nr:ABC transporter permease [Terriglobales bacterium]
MEFFKRKQKDLDAEINSHLDMAARDHKEQGSSDREARETALREFGNVGLVKEATREMWSGMFLETLLQDVRYGLRMLVKCPGFSLTAILTLALGIGANTAIFSVVNGVLLDSLPYPQPNRIAVLFQRYPGNRFPKGAISYANFLDWQKMNRTFSAMAAYRNTRYTLVGQGMPELVRGEMISAGFFEMLGVKPLLGRTFTADEDRLSTGQVALISERLWHNKFGADPAIVGKRAILDDVGRTIVGVIPSSFELSIHNFQNWPATDVYTPIGQFAEPGFRDRDSASATNAIGRLKPGVTLQQAHEDMERVSRELATAYPDADSNLGVNMVPLREEMVGELRTVLLVLLGAVGFVLLIACVNVANLLLARSKARQREFAVRLALGAGQARLIRQLLTESILLAVVGGAFGVLLAHWGLKAIVTNLSSTLPRVRSIGLNPPVLLFTLFVSIAVGIVFGLTPAWKSSRPDWGHALKDAGRSMAGSRSRAQSAFVIAEMAMALVLLVGAGLMVRTLFHLWASDPGFNPHNVETFSTRAPSELGNRSPEAIRSYYGLMQQELASTPGVKTVSFSAQGDPMQSDSERYFAIVGTPKPAHLSDLPMSLIYTVGPEYLNVMQIPLRRGRFLAASDTEHTQPVVVIDESFARRYFPGRDPIGHYLDFDPATAGSSKHPPYEIAGVVGHINQWGLGQDDPGKIQGECYFAYWQMSDREVTRMARYNGAYLRTKEPGVPDLETLRSRLLRVDSQLVVHDFVSMDQVLADTIAEKRVAMSLLSAFAALALLLAGIGIYGVLSYVVGQRTQEIGVRVALGAQRRHVLGTILVSGAKLAAIGIGIGILAALGVTQLMSSMLFGVKPTDPATFAAVAGLLAGIALLACYIPARRAARLDPMVALRCG